MSTNNCSLLRWRIIWKPPVCENSTGKMVFPPVGKMAVPGNTNNRIRHYNRDFVSLFLFFLILSVNFGANAQKVVTNPINISINALVGLQYDLVRFKVKPGSNVVLSLGNVSDMSHNLLITKPGARLEVVNDALQLAEKGPQMDYIPRIDAILYSIPVVSPGQVKSVSFTAPAQQGVYPYVCTFPGHGFVMYGAMYVVNDDSLPDITRDLNIPESRRDAMAMDNKDSGSVSHMLMNSNSTEPVPPYLYNVYMEGASPAAIVVRLPQDLSYCWDETACQLRFAWKGGFVDMSDLWKGHFNASAKVLGDIFFRDHVNSPIRLGDDAVSPVVKYKGYRLINRFPEFHYTVNGLDVYEIIRAKSDGSGLIRNLRIPHADRVVWLFTNPEDDAVEYEFSTGKLKDGKLRLSPSEAKGVVITMTSYHLLFKNNRKK
ncbi:MAG: plastocyanin/azurin family copper-binding protein [Chitinophagaceae bacterium]